MAVNPCLHAFGATITDFDTVSLEDLLEVVIFWKMLSSKFKKYLLIFVDKFLLKGGLNQIILYFAVTFVANVCNNRALL